jgi:hypothetical protein
MDENWFTLHENAKMNIGVEIREEVAKGRSR